MATQFCRKGMDMILTRQCIRLKAARGAGSKNGCAQKYTCTCIQASLLWWGSYSNCWQPVNLKITEALKSTVLFKLFLTSL